jgi:hypothetical protein
MFRVARRYLSLATGVFWLLHALTGMTLVFHRELDDWGVKGPAHERPLKGSFSSGQGSAAVSGFQRMCGPNLRLNLASEPSVLPC